MHLLSRRRRRRQKDIQMTTDHSRILSDCWRVQSSVPVDCSFSWCYSCDIDYYRSVWITIDQCVRENIKEDITSRFILSFFKTYSTRTTNESLEKKEKCLNLDVLTTWHCLSVNLSKLWMDHEMEEAKEPGNVVDMFDAVKKIFHNVPFAPQREGKKTPKGIWLDSCSRTLKRAKLDILITYT